MKQEEASVEVLQSQEVVQEAPSSSKLTKPKKSLIVSKNEQEIVLV